MTTKIPSKILSNTVDNISYAKYNNSMGSNKNWKGENENIFTKKKNANN